MPLPALVDLEAILSATSELMAQVAIHQAAARQLSSLAEHCGGAPVVMHDLDALAGAASTARQQTACCAS